MEFCWRADDGPLSSLPSSTKTACNIKKKNVVRVETIWIRVCWERERERERERAHGARDTFSHDFDFYVVQTAERVVYVYCYVTWNKLVFTRFETGQNSDNDYTAIMDPKTG